MKRDESPSVLDTMPMSTSFLPVSRHAELLRVLENRRYAVVHERGIFAVFTHEYAVVHDLEIITITI
jgi:hypothetical protein